MCLIRDRLCSSKEAAFGGFPGFLAAAPRPAPDPRRGPLGPPFGEGSPATELFEPKPLPPLPALLLLYGRVLPVLLLLAAPGRGGAQRLRSAAFSFRSALST
eukprot:CAMPEP_0197660158 /NCGR_PEP_ID=MMETSP1338-20131121/50676_1 /TAXON_ID=43686 ORGANISM="Pelagodinium beii, Strain RCC1491" /NCGR_SAMPLE_ID=MMETSP1338 /ASSEMBLY_ACC=CAM_ASM_000754 /LENGTH=101 /DNA_ID=CAMNT_0043237453 /DNA_START=417 /DNA_END=722 /DNA_ORIENTATION=+